MTIMKHSKYVKLKDGYTEWASWVLDYEEYNYPDDCKKVIQLICDNLEVKMCPTQYRELNKKNNLFGHCYHSTQALWYFFRKENFKIYSAPCPGPAEYHWWLEDHDGKILDATAGQYDLFEFGPPYEKGKESKWYGWKHRPHRKTQKLMNKIQTGSKLYFKEYMKKPVKSY